jgi:HlyD family secretion protein
MFTGRVEQVRIAGTATNNVVTYTVVVRAQNPRQRLLPGMTATVRIITGTRSDVLRVPNEAVRFTPPDGVKRTEEAQRPNRDDAIVTTLSEKLGLSAEQVEKFRAGLAAQPRGGASSRDMPSGGRADGSRGSGSSGNAGGDERRSAQNHSLRVGPQDSQGQGRVSRVLEGLLTPEQMTKFVEIRSERRETMRPALVWVPSDAGLQPRRITLGLSDENFTEILSGDLREGTQVVTRARSITGETRRGGEGEGRGRRGT